MPRKPRENVENGIYHVYARGNGKQVIFRDDRDRLAYLSLLSEVVDHHELRCLAYCLMDNHIHLVLETPLANLSFGMQALHSEYAQNFNERHDRVGHLFQGRYGAVRIKTDAQLWTVLAYIAANPVEAGLVEKPEAWRWSSYAAVIGPAPLPRLLDWPHLRSYLQPDHTGAIARYRRLVEGARALASAFTESDPAASLCKGSDP